jgi:AraC-like DNA-binding protein
MKGETLSTSDLPAPQQFDAWMDWFDGIFDVLPHHPSRSGFQAQSQSWHIGGCALSRVWAPAIRVEHNIAHIRRHPLDHWVITLSRHATSLISSGDKALRVPPGTPFVVSLADELMSERAEDRRLQLYMSRDKFADLTPALDRARGTALDTTLGSLLGDYLELLELILPDVAHGELDRLSDAIGAMVAACLPAGRGRADVAHSQIDIAWLERIRRTVRKYLRSPALGPRLLCQRLSISRSKLYRLMDAEGGVARYIQRQRLLEAYALLSDPSVDRPITAIGEELCFADTSGFGRAFRREFGARPGEVRAASRTGQKPRQLSSHTSSAAGRSLCSLLRAV